MKNKIVKILIVMLLSYLTQFVIAPAIFPIYFPSSNESTGILFGAIGIGTLFGMIFISDKLRYWICCDIPYFLLMILYSNNGMYGIGVVGIPIDGNKVFYDRSTAIYLVAVVAVLTILIQLLVWVGIRLVKYIRSIM